MGETKVKSITTKAEFDKALAEAKGPVLVDFVMEQCGACVAEAPEVEKLANSCSGTTVLRVDVDQLSDVADSFKVTGTPTIMFAESGAKMTPTDAVEVEDPFSPAFKRKLKCVR